MAFPHHSVCWRTHFSDNSFEPYSQHESKELLQPYNYRVLFHSKYVCCSQFHFIIQIYDEEHIVFGIFNGSINLKQDENLQDAVSNSKEKKINRFWQFPLELNQIIKSQLAGKYFSWIKWIFCISIDSFNHWLEQCTIYSAS